MFALEINDRVAVAIPQFDANDNFLSVKTVKGHVANPDVDGTGQSVAVTLAKGENPVIVDRAQCYGLYRPLPDGQRVLLAPVDFLPIFYEKDAGASL